jgi:hypothetical protein
VLFRLSVNHPRVAVVAHVLRTNVALAAIAAQVMHMLTVALICLCVHVLLVGIVLVEITGSSCVVYLAYSNMVSRNVVFVCILLASISSWRLRKCSTYILGAASKIVALFAELNLRRFAQVN